MTAHRYLLIVFLGVLLAAPVSAQTLVFKGGPSLLANPSPQNATAGDVAANVQLGARVWLTDLFQLQGTFGYNDRFTTEGALYVRPFDPAQTLEPYAFVGYGLMFGDEARRTVFPAGIGVEYQTRTDLGIFFEVAGRWQSERNPGARVNNLNFYVAPSVGVTYQIVPHRPALYARGERSTYEPPVLAEPAEPVAVRAAEPSRVIASAGGMRIEPAAAELAVWDEWSRAADEVLDLGDKVQLPDGTFIMGLTDEDPLLLQTAGLKRVTVSAFVMDKHEVSNADYRAYLDSFVDAERNAMMPDPSAWERAGSASTMQQYFLNDAYADYPVVAVTWRQARDYCAFVDGRLPTEAEWEYAARSGQAGGIYPWPGLEPRDPEGDYLANFNPGRGVYAADGYAFTAPVNAFRPTPWGLHNMSGNVAEWVQDSYAASYSALSNFNPTHEDEGEPRRIVRGGSWASDDFYIGVGVRDAQPADEATLFTGFRCAYGLDADLGVVEAGSDAAPAQMAIDAEDVQ